VSEPAGGIVVEPAAIHDAHAAFADRVTEHGASPVLQVELSPGSNRGFGFDDRESAMRAKTGLIDDDALAARAD
jgi:hypothetical protein